MNRKVRILSIVVLLAVILIIAGMPVLPRLARRMGVSVPGVSPGPVNLISFRAVGP